MSWKDEARAGLNDIWPAALAAVPIGLLFGALAAGKGLSPFEVFLMSVLVFAGGAQFAAVELWTHPAPLFALDRIYWDRHLHGERFHVHTSRLARVASDHLPVVARLRLAAARQRAAS